MEEPRPDAWKSYLTLYSKFCAATKGFRSFLPPDTDIFEGTNQPAEKIKLSSYLRLTHRMNFATSSAQVWIVKESFP
jgi:hypothetical protein